jgi:hypothetical protein
MPNSLGYSLYLSSFAAQCSALGGCSDTDTAVFLSLHISEEFDESYCRRAEEICHELADKGFRIIADVSVKTLQQFGCDDLVALGSKLRLWALRIDYGFTKEEIITIAKQMPVVLNASTTTPEDAKAIAAESCRVFAMHNFYPRPETGLDDEYLLESTRSLQSAGLEVLAFIPGDAQRRGPLFEGLPTLEDHRNVLPSAAFVDLAQRFGIEGIFLGDPGISRLEARRIACYCQTGIISVPAVLDEKYAHLYDQVFTCRVDSPKWLVRFQESRVYSCQGQITEPCNCLQRTEGSLTIDNIRYGRYSGEIMLTRSCLPADDRVNVIGQVPENARLLLNLIGRGTKFTLVKP